MAEEPLDEANVHTRLQEHRGSGMAHHVWGHMACQAGNLCKHVYLLANSGC